MFFEQMSFVLGLLSQIKLLNIYIISGNVSVKHDRREDILMEKHTKEGGKHAIQTLLEKAMTK